MASSRQEHSQHYKNLETLIITAILYCPVSHVFLDRSTQTLKSKVQLTKYFKAQIQVAL